jgi:hypothetical protein
MLDQLVDKIAETVSRRRLLGRLASACSAVAVAILGFAQPASAGYKVACCNLCNHSTTCTGNYAGSWCWTCQYKTRCSQGDNCCLIYTCTEYYDSSVSPSCFAACDQGILCNQCNGTPCSTAVNTGNFC